MTTLRSIPKVTTVKPKKPKRRPLGLYLRNDTMDDVKKIAAEHKLAIHAVVSFAVTDFVKRYKKGKVTLRIIQQNKIDI